MIQLKDVELIIKDQTVKVNDFIFRPNGKYVIKAPSGKGKTTLLESYMGLRSNVGGTITVNDLIVNSKNIHKIRKMISYLPQEIPLFNDSVINVINNLVINVDHHLLDELLVMVDLDKNKLNQNYTMLSGGEKKRLGILISILQKRKILLMDELDHGIDQERLIEIMDYLAKQEMLIIINSHHPDVIGHHGFYLLGGELFD
jgi:ABC-type multidrug transport system ATPase subunit